MTDREKIFFKARLKEFAKAVINERIQSLKTVIENARQAANNEEKSSAGDKYETARAMSHLEKDMHARQLAENIKELSLLHAINIHSISTEASAGAYLQCNGISFFIAAGLGKQTVDDKKIIFLSPQSPLATSILHKKEGDKFLFNQSEVIIAVLF